MQFLDHLAEDQLGRPEHVQWTEEQIAHIFSVGLHLMNLPIGSKKHSKPIGGNASAAALMDSQKKGKMEIFACLIVNLIFPSTVKTPSSFPHLKKLIHILENFLHPSNHGQWTPTLTRFVSGLASCFLSRMRRGTCYSFYFLEKDPLEHIPVSHHLTCDVKKEFVELLRQPVFLAMFGKDGNSRSYAHNALKSLAWIEPDIILPPLLERIYPALETLTEVGDWMMLIEIDTSNHFLYWSFRLCVFCTPGSF